ncbi:MAG: hypothetical protein R2754_13090 [Microthrixaceae bacterium]
MGPLRAPNLNLRTVVVAAAVWLLVGLMLDLADISVSSWLLGAASGFYFTAATLVVGPWLRGGRTTRRREQ